MRISPLTEIANGKLISNRLFGQNGKEVMPPAVWCLFRHLPLVRKKRPKFRKSHLDLQVQACSEFNPQSSNEALGSGIIHARGIPMNLSCGSVFWGRAPSPLLFYLRPDRPTQTKLGLPA